MILCIILECVTYQAILADISQIAAHVSFVSIQPGNLLQMGTKIKYSKNKATTAVVISRLRISNNGEVRELEEGVKGKSQQLEKSLRL